MVYLGSKATSFDYLNEFTEKKRLYEVPGETDFDFITNSIFCIPYVYNTV